jgi:dihydropyrimidinase
MKIDTLIKNGVIVTTEGIFAGGIGINGEKIVTICTNENIPNAERVIDAKGNFIIPGLVDPHVHFLLPPTDEWAKRFASETQAAASGGVTTSIHCLLEHEGGSIVECCKKLRSIFEASSYVDLALNAAIFNLDQIKEMRDALEYGVSSFKFLLCYKGRETLFNLPGIDDGIVYLGFEQIARLVKEGYKTFARVHAETIEIYFRLEDRYREQGKVPTTHTEVRPPFLEVEGLQKSIIWAKATGCPLFIVHLSIKEGIDMICKARLEGVDIVAETCPHYLVLNTDNTDKILSKVNPPIRHKEDNEALWQALRDGVIDFVATDHGAPVKAEKTDFWHALGLAGIETMLPIMLSEGVNKGRITLERLVEVCCYNPAKKYGLIPRKGTIGIGSDADLVIVDLNKKNKVNAENFYSRADFSCYEGWELQGWPVLTMVRGNIVIKDGKVVGEPGFGRFIPANIH